MCNTKICVYSHASTRLPGCFGYVVLFKVDQLAIIIQLGKGEDAMGAQFCRDIFWVEFATSLSVLGPVGVITYSSGT